MKKTPLTVILILASSLSFGGAAQVARAEPAPGSLIGYTELRTSLSEATELCDDTLHAWKIDTRLIEGGHPATRWSALGQFRRKYCHDLTPHSSPTTIRPSRATASQ